MQTSNLSHIVAYGKAYNFLTSKVKDEGQGQVKGQNNLFDHNFGSICHRDFQLVSFCSLWKDQKFLTSKVKDEGQGHVKGQNNILAIIFVLFVLQTSNLSHIVAYGKAYLV